VKGGQTVPTTVPLKRKPPPFTYAERGMGISLTMSVWACATHVGIGNENIHREQDGDQCEQCFSVTIKQHVFVPQCVGRPEHE
jgi:hypothetical protein